MLMVSSYPSFASRLTQTVIAIALFSSVLWMTTADAGPLSIALRGARAFPESITSARDGTLFIGRLGDGGIIRANLRTGKASLFVALGASGSRSITGVFADEASKTLWACSNDLSALGGNSGGRDRGSALKGFDLRTSAPKLSAPLPDPNAFCNDTAVDAWGAVCVTDSAAPTVLRLPARASTFEVFASNPQFLPPKVGSAGLDGTAFGGDGNLYVTTYAVGGLFLIDVDHGRAGRVTKLRGALLTLPDGLRPLVKDSSWSKAQGPWTGWMSRATHSKRRPYAAGFAGRRRSRVRVRPHGSAKASCRSSSTALARASHPPCHFASTPSP
jgi:hypothetical protein